MKTLIKLEAGKGFLNSCHIVVSTILFNRVQLTELEGEGPKILSPSVHAASCFYLLHFIITTPPLAHCLHPEELNTMFEEEKRDIKGSTGSLNVKYAYKEPAIKQAVTSSLSRASHFSSGPVRLSFSADLGCA